MSKFLFTGDWHGDAYTAGVRRYEDVANAAAQTVAAASAMDVNYYIFLGDLADPDTPGVFWAQRLAAQVHLELSCSRRPSSYWLVGNHDIVDDGYGTHTLLPLAPRAKVIDEPQAIQLESKTADSAALWLLCFPYTSTSRSYDPAKKAAEFREIVPEKSRVVIVSHLMLEGISPGSETEDMRRGRDVFLPVGVLPTLFPGCLMVNGHYHKRQTYRGVEMPGSLIRNSQSEVGNLPGFITAEK